MILPAQEIRRRCREEGLLLPWSEQRKFEGCSYGIGPAGYDIRLAEDVWISSNTSWGESFVLASSLEHFNMPDDLLAQVCDKSTWARTGLLVQNTVIEPGWRGYLTLELTFHGQGGLSLIRGTPIAQIVFMRLESPTEQPYDGKYQDQEPEAVPARRS